MDSLISLRHELHKYPELSGKEVETAKKIRNYLTSYNPITIVENIGGHGLVAEYKYSEKEPSIIIRCELDALPIPEDEIADYSSTTQGISHKCGHDGHIAMVAGLAPWLSKQKFNNGSVYLLFQPAEETGKGALSMLADPKMDTFSPDYIFALHNLPGYPMHEIIRVDNQFNATVLSLAIVLKGKTSHASEPEKGKNPSLAIARLTMAILKLEKNDPASEDFALITPVHTTIGSKNYGISPGHGEIHFTIRTWNRQKIKSLTDKIDTLLREECATSGLDYKTGIFDYFPSVINDPLCNDLVENVACDLKLKVQNVKTPIRFGEDFGFFTERFRGVMFGLGAGIETPPLHSVDYDFPDELIETGLSMFKGIITKILSSKK